MMAQTKMHLNKRVKASCIFVQDMVGLIDAVELLILRLLIFGIFVYGVVQVVRHF
jgi:hypothetical protein